MVTYCMYVGRVYPVNTVQSTIHGPGAVYCEQGGLAVNSDVGVFDD